MYDIVVVGGGPAGCYAASLLAENGLDVHVLEEHSVIGEPVDCSGVIGAESFNALHLPDSLKLGEVKALTLVSPSQLKVCFLPSSPLAYIVDRAGLDRAIARKATESGAKIHLGCGVTDLRVFDDCVELDVEARKPGAEEAWKLESKGAETLRARVVILAGGPRYKFQRKLGMGQPRNFLKTAQLETPIRGIQEPVVYVGSEVAPGSFAWIVPFQRRKVGYARIGVSAREGAVPYLQKLLRRLFTEGYLQNLDAPIRSWVIPISPLRKTYADRVLTVGDAAGQTKPTTGGGIYYGLLCAEATAEVVAEAFNKGDFSARTLNGYERLWRRRLGREISIGAFFRRLAERLTDKEIDKIFRIVQSDGVLSGVARTARFDWHRDVILFALRHPALGRIFLRGLFRW